MKFRIHPLFYLFLFIFFLIGYINYFIKFMMIIFVHELGHIFASIILKWKIDKIEVYPFGCITRFNESLNSSMIEEFLILLYGPLFQIIFNMLYPLSISKYILLFNLLPIYPLDGSKFIFLLLNNIVSYYNSYLIILVISFFTIILYLRTNISLLNIILAIYLIYDLIRNVYNFSNIMLRFYYDRYKSNIKYRKNKFIKGLKLKKISKNRNNYFICDKKCINEHIILGKMFDK